MSSIPDNPQGWRSIEGQPPEMEQRIDRHWQGESPSLPPRSHHASQPADRVTDNRDKFRRKWLRVATATHFTEAE